MRSCSPGSGPGDDEGPATVTRLAPIRVLLVEHLDVSCVLLDLGLPDAMPDAMGLGERRRLLAAGSPAVVVLTGLAGTDVGMRAVAACAQAYLVEARSTASR